MKKYLMYIMCAPHTIITYLVVIVKLFTSGKAKELGAQGLLYYLEEEREWLQKVKEDMKSGHFTFLYSSVIFVTNIYYVLFWPLLIYVIYTL